MIWLIDDRLAVVEDSKGYSTSFEFDLNNALDPHGYATKRLQDYASGGWAGVTSNIPSLPWKKIGPIDNPTYIVNPFEE
ncbi:hypothetical protein [Acetivibrio cellulolyticus]|uniref:hypothetical protein n=1 Tax=Acetivibrio cellulolyticus TaxID=35830 RepID=UPI0001E30198|nr:hypothetical protein [Acetivibrio cellulolyticus]